MTLEGPVWQHNKMGTEGNCFCVPVINSCQSYLIFANLPQPLFVKEGSFGDTHPNGRCCELTEILPPFRKGDRGGFAFRGQKSVAEDHI